MDMAWQAEQFEAHRQYLQAVAYRMLGTTADAEDAVQEAWMRLSRADGDSINNVAAWLTTVVGRVCVDILRSRRVRREQPFEEALPPAAPHQDAGSSNPEQQALIADSVGLALMVVLDTLTPAERLAFVLHDLFGVGYDEIGFIVERSEDAARQLASRARRRVRRAPAPTQVDAVQQREIVAAFLVAARHGDFAALVAMLDPDVVFRIEPGSRPWIGPTVIEGRHDVAQHAAVQGPQFAPTCRVATVDGGLGIIAETAVGVIAVATVALVGEQIAAIDLKLDPATATYSDATL